MKGLWRRGAATQHGGSSKALVKLLFRTKKGPEQLTVNGSAHQEDGEAEPGQGMGAGGGRDGGHKHISVVPPTPGAGLADTPQQRSGGGAGPDSPTGSIGWPGTPSSIGTQVAEGDVRHLTYSRAPPEMTEQVQSMLAKIGHWEDFDIFELKRLTGGRPLYAVCMCLMEQEQLLEPHWKVSRERAQCFFAAVEAAYEGSNAYHNSTHAADVTQAALVMLKAGQAAPFTKLEVFALIVSAAVHDLAHPGFTNDFLINTRHANAIIYNDRSVNENYHVSCAFRLAQSPETNVFDGLTRQEFVQARRLIVNAVLSTDMTQHLKLVEAFRKAQAAQPALDTWEDVDLILQMVLHAADLCNPCRPLCFSIKWGELICCEFLEQGDQEVAQGLTVTPMCDRQRVIVSTNQLRFISFFLKPTLDDCQVVTGTEFYERSLDLLHQTVVHWEEHQRLAQLQQIHPHKGWW